MLLDICLGSKAVWRILIVLSDLPGRGITREEIRKFTKLGSKSLTDSLRTLKEFNIIKSAKESKVTYYKLNLANKFTTQIIELCNLEKENLNNLNFEISIILREFIRMCLDIIKPNKIIVFGSSVKTRYRKDSDIDVCLITKNKIKVDDDLKLEHITEKIEKRFKRNIQIHNFTEEEFEKLKKSKNLLVNEIIRDGVIVV
ncbi:MAG: nucleotidyltransferase domain-containing protein [Nanoarchaeota archaeon]|nr:nucleotidyltransferase domain-containing protein [Nanoarchaeota archaeon]